MKHLDFLRESNGNKKTQQLYYKRGLRSALSERPTFVGHGFDSSRLA